MTCTRSSFNRSPVAGVTVPDNLNPVARLFRWLLWIVRFSICLVRGHETVLHFERRRLALRCPHCGYESTGWVIGEFRPSRVVTRLTPREFTASNRAA